MKTQTQINRMLILLFCLMLSWVLSPLPAQDFEVTSQPNPPLKEITAHLRQATIQIEIAAIAVQRERGLMWREKLKDNAGMLFLMPQKAVATFWMKNTSIPLSVAYLNQKGDILEIYDMQPFDLTTIRSQSDQVAYALEMNQHWFDLNQVKPGDRLDISPKTWSQLASP